MKKTLIILIPSLIIVAAVVLFFSRMEKKSFEGIWTLKSSSEGCFTRVRFHDIPNYKGIIIDETEGNFTQVWFGTYAMKKDIISVQLTEPKADPFTMTASQGNNQLHLQYNWKGKNSSCSYEIQ